MTFHPRERPVRPGIDRRTFLRRSAFGAAAVTLGPSLLAACGGDDGGGGGGGGEAVALSRPDNPVTLPTFDDIPMIADGLDPEAGPLKIYNYAEYIAPRTLRGFREEYGVEVEVTPYNNYDQMIAKLQEPGAEYDVVFPGPTVLSKMVYGEVIQPLNQSYLPNMENLWPEYKDPWYDKGAQYTVPYTVYTTGIGYRADIVTDLPDPGYDVLWDPAYNGKAALLDDYGEAISMSILRNGLGSVNTDDQTIVAKAVDSLIELIELVNIKVSITGYRSIPEGEYTVSQSWSGDLLAARWYLPKGESLDVLGYWVPEEVSQRVIGNDVLAIPKSATKPVLSHLFLNTLLDNDVSEKNFNWNGYQPPLTKISVPYAIDQGYIVESLSSAIVLPEDFQSGIVQVEQPPSVESMWRNEWARFKAGA